MNTQDSTDFITYYTEIEFIKRFYERLIRNPRSSKIRFKSRVNLNA